MYVREMGRDKIRRWGRGGGIDERREEGGEETDEKGE